MTLYYVRFLVGSDNVAHYGPQEGPFGSVDEAKAHGEGVLDREGAASPGDAGPRDYVVEEGEES